jgi:hypothetical protein
MIFFPLRKKNYFSVYFLFVFNCCRQTGNKWSWKELVQASKNLVMSDLVKFLSLSNPLKLCSDHFSGQLCQPGCINKDPTLWQDEARQPLKYVSITNKSLTYSKILPAWLLSKWAGNTCWKERLGTVDSIIKIACFVIKENNIGRVKSCWSNLNSTGRSTVLSFPLQ